jgi:hypothetical protein
MDFQKSIIGVGLARKQRFGLLTSHFIAQGAQRRLRFRNDRRIAVGLAQLDQAGVVGQRPFKAQHPFYAALKLLAGAHDGLGFLRIVPKSRVFDLGIQAG